MFRRFAGALALLVFGLAGIARADTLVLDQATINGFSVGQLNGGSGGGASYTNTIATGAGDTAVVGDTIKVIGFDFPSSIQSNVNGLKGAPLPTGLASLGVEVFAASGFITSVTPLGGSAASFNATFNKGTIQYWGGVNAAGFSSADPATWTAGGTLVETFSLHTAGGAIPGGFNTAVVSNPLTGPGVSQPPPVNFGSANAATPFNGNTITVFDEVSNPGGFIPTAGIYQTFATQLSNPSAFNAGNADTLFGSLLVGDLFRPGGETYAPGYTISGGIFSGSDLNGDVQENLGTTTFFGAFIPQTLLVPEPASMLLWGALVAGGGVYRTVRKRLKKTA